MTDMNSNMSATAGSPNTQASGEPATENISMQPGMIDMMDDPDLEAEPEREGEQENAGHNPGGEGESSGGIHMSIDEAFETLARPFTNATSTANDINREEDIEKVKDAVTTLFKALINVVEETARNAVSQAIQELTPKPNKSASTAPGLSRPLAALAKSEGRGGHRGGGRNSVSSVLSQRRGTDEKKYTR